MSPIRGHLVRSAGIALALLWALALPATAAAAVTKPTPPQNVRVQVASHAGTTARLHVTWSAPADDGDGTGPYRIGAYNVAVTPSLGSGCTTNGVTLACDINGFTLGTSYKIMVTATNTYDMTSDPGWITYKVPVLPSAPSGLTATIVSNENSRATVKFAWNAPSSDGGSPITAYTLSGGSGISCTTAGTTRTCQISGLWSNRTFAFSVVATNVIGSGPAAQVSVSIPASPGELATVSPDSSALASTPAQSASPQASDSPSPSDSASAPPASPSATQTVSESPSPAPSASSSVAPSDPNAPGDSSGPDLLIMMLVAAAATVLVGGGALAWVVRNSPSN